MREEGRGVGGATPLLHSNFQSWQMRSLPTLDPYRILLFGFSNIVHFSRLED